MNPEWCPQWAWDEVQRWEREEIVSSVTMTVRQAERHNRNLRLRALLDVHQRGRREGMEEAAEVAREMLVYADTTSEADVAIPAAISAKAQEAGQ